MAFDLANSRLLMGKINSSVNKDWALFWPPACLRSRFFCIGLGVAIPGRFGVLADAQREVLGALLLLLYIKDLAAKRHLIRFTAADEVKVFEVSNREELARDLKEVRD